MAPTPDLTVNGQLLNQNTSTVTVTTAISGGTRTDPDVIGVVSVWTSPVSALTFNYLINSPPRVSATWGGRPMTLFSQGLGSQVTPLFPPQGTVQWWTLSVFYILFPSLSGNIVATVQGSVDGQWNPSYDDVVVSGTTFLDASVPVGSTNNWGGSGTSGSQTLTRPSGHAAYFGHGNATSHSAYNQTTLSNTTYMRTGWTAAGTGNITSTLTQTSIQWAAAGMSIPPYTGPINAVGHPELKSSLRVRTSSGWQGTIPRKWDGTKWVPVVIKRAYGSTWY